MRGFFLLSACAGCCSAPQPDPVNDSTCRWTGGSISPVAAALSILPIAADGEFKQLRGGGLQSSTGPTSRVARRWRGGGDLVAPSGSFGLAPGPLAVYRLDRPGGGCISTGLPRMRVWRSLPRMMLRRPQPLVDSRRIVRLSLRAIDPGGLRHWRGSARPARGDSSRGFVQLASMR